MKRAFIFLFCFISYLYAPAQNVQDTSISSEPVDHSGNLPVVSVENAMITEGDQGTCYMVISLSLSKRSKDPVKVQFNTMGTMYEEGQEDHLQKKGTVVFPSNRLLQTVRVQVDCDIHSKLNKTFFVKLSGAANATPEHVVAIGNMKNNDAVPVVKNSN